MPGKQREKAPGGKSFGVLGGKQELRRKSKTGTIPWAWSKEKLGGGLAKKKNQGDIDGRAGCR